MAIVYEAESSALWLDEEDAFDPTESIQFYCGSELDETAIFLANLVAGNITLQSAYSQLLQQKQRIYDSALQIKVDS
jgi:hypothetical protein